MKVKCYECFKEFNWEPSANTIRLTQELGIDLEDIKKRCPECKEAIRKALER